MERHGPEIVEQPARHGSGWRFLTFAALTLLTVIALAGWGPDVVNDLRYAQDERENAARMEPARLQVTRMEPPADTRPCEYSQSDLDTWGQFCWHHASDVQRALTVAQRAFERVGGVVVDKECVKDPAGQLACLIYGEVQEAPFFINAFRPALPKGGRSSEVRVTGGLDGVRDYPRLFERILPGDTPPTSDGWWGGYEPAPPAPPVPGTLPISPATEGPAA